MSRFSLIGGVMLFLILDFLALDDITTGNEPDFYTEYLILIISLILYLLIGYKSFIKRR